MDETSLFDILLVLFGNVRKAHIKIKNKFFISVAVDTCVIPCFLLDCTDISEQRAFFYSLGYEPGTYLLLSTVEM